MRFGGPLEFVNELRRFIPGNGFSDPPGLAVTPSGISASYSLNLPAIEVGIFALTNASLGAGFNLPFDAQPGVGAGSTSRSASTRSASPSRCSAAAASSRIGVSARGVNEIEAALEFGAASRRSTSASPPAASRSRPASTSTGSSRSPTRARSSSRATCGIHGELTVLAIISVSLTFNLQLGYLKEGGQSTVYGEATLTVEIEILMFSAEVSVKCRREFAGGAADPRFIDLMPTPQIWADYCDAFAEEAV